MQNKKEYCLMVLYPSELYFQGTSPDYLISKILKRHSDGSGMGFGERDLSYYFKSKILAENAKKKIVKCLDKKLLKKLTFSIEEMSDE